MRFYLSLSLRRHFVAWRVLARGHGAGGEEAPSAAVSKARAKLGLGLHGHGLGATRIRQHRASSSSSVSSLPSLPSALPLSEVGVEAGLGLGLGTGFGKGIGAAHQHHALDDTLSLSFSSSQPQAQAQAQAQAAAAALNEHQHLVAAAARERGLVADLRRELQREQEAVIKAAACFAKRALRPAVRLWHAWSTRHRVLSLTFSCLRRRRARRLLRWSFASLCNAWVRACSARASACLLVKDGPGGINEESIAALEETNHLMALQLEQRRSEHRINASRCEQLAAPEGAVFRLEENLAELDLVSKELALSTGMIERELEAVQADTMRLRRESQAVTMLQQAHHNLHARTRSEEEIVSLQLKEKETERNVQRELLETTADHYQRAVRRQSQAQLKVERLLAETKAVLSVTTHHKKRVEQLDVAIAEQTQRRRQTEQRLAHCKETLEDALSKFQVGSSLLALFFPRACLCSCRMSLLMPNSNFYFSSRAHRSARSLLTQQIKANQIKSKQSLY